MTQQEAIVADDNSDLITSHIETAINLKLHPCSRNLELSSDILEFLASEGERPEDVISQPIVEVPEIDDSRPLTHYFISTSHNTYLLGLRLFGEASATAYTHVLSHHCRCVEIDVWPPTSNSGGDPIVTHGHTFSQHISFQDVCAAIGNAIQPDSWPVMISLECHLDIPDQDKIVKTMKEVWGKKLVEKAVQLEKGRLVTPRDLRGRILLMIEYCPLQSPHEPEVELLEMEHENAGMERSAFRPARIGPSLAALGAYAHSVKPTKDWLTKEILDPPYILYNVSESSLGKYLTSALQPLISNSLVYMRRVYPKFMRILSSNLVPLQHWQSGTQVAALNWQRYNKGVEINEAMFVGSGGWVVKPDNLLSRDVNPSGSASRTLLTCEIISGCSIPVKGPNSKAYVRAELFLASCEQKSESPTTTSTSHHAHTGDYIWKKQVKWEYTDDEMAFVRLSVYCAEFGKDERLGTFCARVEYLRPGWKILRLLDRKGKHNGGLLLVQFCVERDA